MKFSQMTQRVGNRIKQRLVPFVNGVYGIYNKLRVAVGNPIVLSDSSDEALVGLKIFGKSTQGGTPTPDAPVEIVNVENPTIIIRNGIYLSDNYAKGVGIMSTNGSQIVNSKSATTEFIPFDFHKYGEIKLSGVPPTLYTFIAAYDINKTFVGRTTATTIDLTYRVNNFTAGAGNGALDTIKYLRVTTYEADAAEGSIGDMDECEIWLEIPPYNEQDITVSTFNGLHGIPVTSGGNYTDADGQQWICDEVDFERGVYVQRVRQKTFDGTEQLRNDWFPIMLFNAENPNLYAIPSVKPLCNYFTTAYIGNQGGSTLAIGGLDKLGFTNISEVQTFMLDCHRDGNPVVIQYALATPIETPLTADQIEAYKSLRTNEPNTTISNDKNAWMEVIYTTE